MNLPMISQATVLQRSKVEETVVLLATTIRSFTLITKETTKLLL